MVEINIEYYIQQALRNIGINTHFEGTEYNPPTEPNINGGVGVDEWVSVAVNVDVVDSSLEIIRDNSLQYGTVYTTIYADTKVRVLEILADLDYILFNKTIATPYGDVIIRTPRRVISGADGKFFAKYAWNFYI